MRAKHPAAPDLGADRKKQILKSAVEVFVFVPSGALGGASPQALTLLTTGGAAGDLS